jgi:outer membrane protein OmpA-like peptidoglycan-associated protein
MRTAGVLISLLLCLTSRAQAQVSVDMRALDSLGPAQATPRAAPTPPRRPPATPAPVVTRAPAARPAVADKPAAVPPAVTASPAPIVSAPPPALPTEQPSAPPASATVAAPAASPVPLPPPVRLVFDGGQTDLTPADEAAIRDLARAIPAPAADSVNVVAYAAGKPDDPSTARRVSLSRGMAVRSVLMDSGVPSAQIYVRAMGSTGSGGPADRVELTIAPIGTVTR